LGAIFGCGELTMRTASALVSSWQETRSGLTVLTGARVAHSAESAEECTLSLRGARIDSMNAPAQCLIQREDADEIDLSGFLVLPGLINAHDHLDFSLFPRLGQGPWQNWREWVADIYRPDESPAKEHLRVPRAVRYWWGGIRNLLSGVTTVSHHDPWLPEVFDAGFPVQVPAEYGWAHSVADPVQAVERFRETPRESPFILHLAEGTDAAAQTEFDELESLLPLDDRIVFVHGVGLTEQQWQRAQGAGTGLIWCPASNLYNLGQTLPLDRVQNFPGVALGTDSPITFAGDMLDQIQFVAREMHASARFLYELVTDGAARILRLKRGEGSLRPGHAASFVAVRDRKLAPAETLVQLSWHDVELVIESGRIVLLSASIATRIPPELKEGMEWIRIDGIERLVRAPVRELFRQTLPALGSQLSLTGREVALRGG
jgi:cytosine/adenosine deaminase-related metal-dependent hydrolase